MLTEAGADATPMLSPDGTFVAFTRLAQGADDAHFDPTVRDLWVIRLTDHKAFRLVAGVPERNEPPEKVPADIGRPVDVVSQGKYKGALVVEQHRYRDGHGSWDPAVLVSPSGAIIKVIGEDNDALQNVEREHANFSAPTSRQGTRTLAALATPGLHFLSKVTS